MSTFKRPCPAASASTAFVAANGRICRTINGNSSWQVLTAGLDTTAYYMDIENLQATVTAGTCSSRVIFNVPKARSTGIELEWAAAPSDRFDFSISANYGKSELRSTLTSTDAAGNRQVVAGIESGNRLPTVPELQASATGTYQWPMRNTWLGYVTGTWQYIGSRFTQIGDQAVGFGIVNLNSFGANTIGGELRPLAYGVKMIGQARTVEAWWDNTAACAALPLMAPGQVMVIDANAGTDRTT